jgi:hypothetical protein
VTLSLGPHVAYDYRMRVIEKGEEMAQAAVRRNRELEKVLGLIREAVRRLDLNGIRVAGVERYRRGADLPGLPSDGAVNLISTLPDVPLRTLDAMHLVIAREIDDSILATADRSMPAGAHEMGFSVVRFFR